MLFINVFQSLFSVMKKIDNCLIHIAKLFVLNGQIKLVFLIEGYCVTFFQKCFFYGLNDGQ